MLQRFGDSWTFGDELGPRRKIVSDLSEPGSVVAREPSDAVDRAQKKSRHRVRSELHRGRELTLTTLHGEGERHLRGGHPALDGQCHRCLARLHRPERCARCGGERPVFAVHIDHCGARRFGRTLTTSMPRRRLDPGLVSAISGGIRVRHTERERRGLSTFREALSLDRIVESVASIAERRATRREHAKRERPRATILRDLHQDAVPPSDELDRHDVLVEQAPAHGFEDESALPVDPDRDAIVGAEQQGHLPRRGDVNVHVAIGAALGMAIQKRRVAHEVDHRIRRREAAPPELRLQHLFRRPRRRFSDERSPHVAWRIPVNEPSTNQSRR